MNIAILGASRGLGLQLALVAAADNHRLFLSSRTQKWVENSILYNCDFSRTENLEGLIRELKSFGPQAIWYAAGGGPYGEYSSKNWRDHLWAWQVNHLTPAYLIHSCLRGEISACRQFIIVGSAVAESGPDPMASSYCAAKHALKGLISSIQQELVGVREFDLRLYSPGYMDTNMLPPKAVPRQKMGKMLLDPSEVAADFYRWSMEPSVSNKLLPSEWHRVLPNLGSKVLPL